MKKNKLLSSYVKKGTQPMKSPNLVSLSSSDNINNITFGDLDILDANSTKLVAGQSGSGISYEDIEGHLFESFISKNINVGDNYSLGVSVTKSEIRLASDLDNYYDGTLINNNNIRIGSGLRQAEIGVGGIKIGTGSSLALIDAGYMKIGPNILLGTGIIEAIGIIVNSINAGGGILIGTGIVNTSTVKTDYITTKDTTTGKLSIKNEDNIALEILRTSVNSRVYMPLLGYTPNLNYTSLHACGGIFVGDQYFSAVENKYYPELSLHTHSGAWIHNIFSRSNMYRLSYAHKNNSDLSCTITIDTDGTIGGDAKIANQQSVTYQLLYNMRSNLKLIPGRFYRITDYVTTTMQKDTRSAGHLFDIIVRADSNNTLSETAWAAKHSGDTYFQNAKLEAWELKYNLDNVQWSQRVGTVIEDENDLYTAISIGTVNINDLTYILWDASNFEYDYGFTQMVSLTKEVGADMWIYDPATGEKGEDVQTSIAAVIGEYTLAGNGTITWMKDEHGNECPYDFKNIQYKRYMTTDSVSEREGLDGLYMVADPAACPQGLSVEDTEDFIWAYTFSSDNAGGEQTDYSLTAAHYVHDNVFRPYSGGLPNNVMFGEYNYSNSFGMECNNNSWGNNCNYNSWGNYCQNNSWGNNNRYNSWGNNCYSNSWGNYCQNNSWGNNCYSNSWGNYCQNNSWGNNVTQSTLFEGVQYTQITTENVKNVQVLNGVKGTPSSKLTLTFAANKAYTQVAAMTAAGQLKIWNPADLVL